MTYRSLTRQELAQLEQNTLAYPVGPPDDRWSAEELRAYLIAQQAQIDALEPMDVLALDTLPTPDLEALMAATTQEETDQIRARIQARINDQKQRRQQPRKVKVTR